LLPGNDGGRHVRLYNRLGHRYHDVNVHETVDAADHQIKPVDGILIHRGFLSIQDHVIRFNSYTDLDASERFARHESFSLALLVIMPPTRFLYQMLYRGLWRRGLIGIFVSLLWVYYDILIQMKLYELRWKTSISTAKSSA
jgi:hypothetical protein